MTKNGMRASDLITLTLIVACVVTAAIVGFLVACDPRILVPPAPITRAPSVTPSPFEVTRVFTNTPTQTAALPRVETVTSTPTMPPTLTATPTLSPTVTPTPTLGLLTPPGRNGTMPTTGADPTELFFIGALQPLGNIEFPFTLAEFLGYLAGGILTYPASKFIFEKLDEALAEFGKQKMTRAQKRFAAYPIAALIAVGATVLLHYFGYAPLTADSLYKAFGTAFLTAQALHGYFDLTGTDTAKETQAALVNLYAAVKGFEFAKSDAKSDAQLLAQGEVRERYVELLNAAHEAEKILNPKGQAQ